MASHTGQAGMVSDPCPADKREHMSEYKSEYKSEIRPSDIQALEARAARATSNYRKYLKRLILKRVRGFTEREVSFDFPVTALVGPNGGGKTTILGAAALAYKAVPPRRFFAKSGKYDASMKDWV